MMHSFIGFLFDLITCQVKFNKKEDKVSLISYKYTVIKNNICFQQYYLWAVSVKWSWGPLIKLCGP